MSEINKRKYRKEKKVEFSRDTNETFFYLMNSMHIVLFYRCFHWSGDLLLTGSSSGNLQVWDMDRGQMVVKKSLHSGNKAIL